MKIFFPPALHLQGRTGQGSFGESALWNQPELSSGSIPQVSSNQRNLGQAHGLVGYLGGLELDVGELGSGSSSGRGGPRSPLLLCVSFGPFLGFLDRI